MCAPLLSIKTFFRTNLYERGVYKFCKGGGGADIKPQQCDDHEFIHF